MEESIVQRRLELTIGLILFTAFVASGGFIAVCLINGCIVLDGHQGSTRVVVEIGQLQTAVQAYKEKNSEFPPCMAEEDPLERKTRFMRHLQTTFSNANYGTAPVNFDRLNDGVQNGFDGGSGYNFLDAASGQIIPLDLNRLDAAESLVFWLGGFPTPVATATGKPVANRLIFGFHRNSDTPFKRDLELNEALDPLHYRTETFYQFDETRLVDQDGDGWLEYIPRPQVGEKRVPPFVYFDAATYVSSSQHADLLGSVRYPAGGSLAEAWGQAVPYLNAFDPHQPTKALWVNPKTFQIQCAGLDSLYSVPPEPDKRRAVVMPEERVYHLPEQEPKALDAQARDNLTNMTTFDAIRQR